jgi:hypothetical protein
MRIRSMVSAAVLAGGLCPGSQRPGLLLARRGAGFRTAIAPGGREPIVARDYGRGLWCRSRYLGLRN